MVGATSRADFQQTVNPNLKIVFDQQIMFKLRAHQSADYFKPLGLKISLQQQAQSQQTLFIELTDESDPLFLHQMVCTEQDFHILKSDQQLLVDFQAFPLSFTELIQYCQGENGYCAVFNAHECTLSVVESNQFRALTHLQLQFKRANDELLKKHLSDRIQAIKSEAAHMKH